MAVPATITSAPPIHIDLDPVGTRTVDRLHLFCQPIEIGGEHGGGDPDAAHRVYTSGRRISSIALAKPSSSFDAVT
jgi:hypothetical protein